MSPIKKSKSLTNLQIKNAKPKDKDYKIFDGNGMYVLITKRGSKLFRWDYSFKNKRKTIALGQYPEISLEEAREKVTEYRHLLKKGIDPSKARKEEKASEAYNFENVAKEWFEYKSKNWSQSHSSKVWKRLNKYLFPKIGSKDIKKITQEDIFGCIEPAILGNKIETARRVLQIASQIFDYFEAKTGKLESNPCYKIKKSNSISFKKAPNHYPAPESVDAFRRILKIIWDYDNSSLIVGTALKVLAYTFQRPGEVRAMKWSDIDFEAREWRFTVSKTKTPHIVPLSNQVIELLQKIRKITGDDIYVFPSFKTKNRPISDMAINSALKSLGIDTKTEITGHGFRAVARTFLHERLGFEPDVIEHQLAHNVPDRLGRAYNRTKFLERRKDMMQVWADFIDELVKN
ncbi:MAG: integrase arm-type DNA-binding domain-containing protein [Candidatus Aenigmatarchaeota archaeon]